MIVRRTEGMLLDGPSRRKDDEIGDRRAGPVAGAGQHGEDARIAMIEADRVDHHKAGEIVLVRHIVTVPGDHIER